MTQGLELPSVVDLTPDRLTAISERRRRASAFRGGAVTRKLPRLVCLALLAAGFVIAPIVSASAAGSSVDVHNPPTGFSNGPGGNRTDIYVHDSVLWLVKEGTHNITPAQDVPDSQRWGQKASDHLTPDSNPFSVVFDKPGKYYYYSSVGGEGGGKHRGLTRTRGRGNAPAPPPTHTP